MVELLEHSHPAGTVRQVSPASLPVEIDERAARRSLREQIAKLEQELAAAFVAAYPRSGIDWTVGSRGGPRVLSLGELEQLRDDLAERLHAVRVALGERAEEEAQARALIECMLLEPARYKWVRVTNAHLGLTGCRSWHVRPRFGVIGMLMGWWRVKISSGCPLATGRGGRRGLPVNFSAPHGVVNSHGSP
ncbi:MAG TPA: hypothetical protein VHE14_06285 [Solirubrobacteraceae bacterium]|nr:hypothetical protein [Solirubrobacteraceae bacterium]